MIPQGLYESFITFLPVMAIVIVALIALVITKKVIYHQAVYNKHVDQAIFVVRVPKDKPKDEGASTNNLQGLRESLARAEIMFAAIGGLKPEDGRSVWLFGRDDSFSFEIVVHEQKISFYVVAPRKSALYLEQQITAHFPDAVMEEVPDYNAFTPQGQVKAVGLKAKRSFIYPFKTYNDLDTDVLNSVINVMSKLNNDESISIQYVVRSAPFAWHKKIKDVVDKSLKEGSLSKGSGSGNYLTKAVDFIINGLFNSGKKPEEGANRRELSEKEREVLKKMEEKNSKAGLEVNLRIVVSAPDMLRVDLYLDNIINSYSNFNYPEYGNSFKKISSNKKMDEASHFIFRRFIERDSFLLNTEELATLYHFPLANNETPNIDWLLSKTAPAPTEVPSEGIALGFNVYRGIKRNVCIKSEDRRRHTYIVGKSGTGKSVLINNLAIQDIQNGAGVCVMDPNGDLIEDILNRIPPERAEDVIVFSPSDTKRPLALNLLEYDERYPEQKSFVINELISILDKLYDLKSTGGPMFEQYIRNALLLIMDDPSTGSTLMEVPKVLADEEFRKMKLTRCHNQTVVDFWRKEAEKAGGEASLANIVPYVTSKLTQFISNDMMRPIIAQQKSSFNLRDLMDNSKILMVDLPKGLIGEMNAYLLGMIIVGKILMAALSRTDMDKNDRKDFYLYIDEFQNFTTASICQILSEARKYALNLIIAHQYIGQLTKGQDTQIKDAIFGNVGTMVSFRVGSDDAEYLTKSFGPVFNEYDLVNVGRGGFLKLLVDGANVRPFSFQTVWPLMGDFHPGLAGKIRELSRYKYGQDRNLIEQEIRERGNI